MQIESGLKGHMKRYALMAFAFFLMSLNGLAGTYYIAANGSDSNNGTSKATPWLHSPGMATCTANCASHTPAGGDQFIFRGGDTWHYGNSTATPYTGAVPSCGPNSGTCGWLIQWSGTSGNPIYWGVDQTWFSGSSWARPIMNGDNPTSTSAVSACAYDESKAQLLNLSVQHNIQIDNIEFTGLCWHGNQANANESICCAGFINWVQSSTTPSNNILSNLYIHGWTHTPFTCSMSGGEPTGTCDGVFGIQGSANSSFGGGDQIANVVIDGADTDGVSLMAIQWACYDVHNSVIRYNSNGAVCNNAHTWYNNLVEYILQSGDGVSHGNATEFNTEWNGVNAFYNNVYRNLWLSGLCEVTWWETPQTTDYNFNNLIYNLGCNGNIFDLVGSSGGGASGWTANVFNNTWVVPAAGAINANPSSTTANWYNNQCIIPGGTAAANCYAGSGTLNYLTNVVQTPSVASGQGFTAAETFPYSPTAGTNSTVGTGTNLESFCTALSNAGLTAAATACQSDTGYACTYNVATHSVTCPARATVTRPASGAWNVGAYQFQSSSQTQPPQPPTSVTATVH